MKKIAKTRPRINSSNKLAETKNSDFLNFSKNYSEALKLVKTQPLKSIEYINKALQYTNNSDNNKKKCLQTRSLCYYILGKIDQALKDANEALEYDKNNVQSIMLKAESLYFKGEYEWALMYFHKGKRIRENIKEFQTGINKCTKAIESGTLVYLNNNINSDNQKLKIINDVTLSDKNEIISKSVNNNKNKKNVANRKILGELHKDFTYLNEIYNKTFLQESFDKKLKGICNNGLEYFNSRFAFLNQQKIESNSA